MAGLVIPVQAQIEQFEEGMKQVGEAADHAVSHVQETFEGLHPDLKPALDRVQAEAGIHARGVGTVLGSFITVGIIAGLAGLATGVISTLKALSDLGDRAEELRLPVNVLQALSVAAAEARVDTTELNKAMDKFVEVSKETWDEGNKAAKALGNIGENFVKAFKEAPTQEARLRVVADALKSTTDEVKRAQVGLQFFNTDNERFTAILARGSQGIDTYIGKLRQLGLQVDESLVKQAQEGRSQMSLLARVVSDEFTTSLNKLIPVLVAVLPYFERIGAAIRDTIASFAPSGAKPLEGIQADLAAAQEKLSVLYAERDKYKDVFVPLSEGAQRALGQIDSYITSTEKRIEELRLLIQDRLQRPPGTPGPGGTQPAFVPRPDLKGDKETQTAFDVEEDRLRRHIALVLADAAAIGQLDEVHAQLRAEMELLAGAQKDNEEITIEQIQEYARLRATMSSQEALTRSGIQLNEEQAETFRELPVAIRQTEGALDSARRAWQGLNQAAQFAGNEMVEALDGILNRTKTFADAMRDILKSLEKALLQALIFGGGPLAGVLGTASGVPGGTGGIIGSFTGRQAGGPVDPGRVYRVGEQGPEIFVPSVGGTIVPNSVMAGSGGGGGHTVNIYAPPGARVDRQSSTSGQDRTEDVFISMMNSGLVGGRGDSALRNRFGARVPPRAR